jgi:hypothetical protein
MMDDLIEHRTTSGSVVDAVTPMQRWVSVLAVAVT